MLQKLKSPTNFILCLLIISLGLFVAPRASAAVCTPGQSPVTDKCDPPKKAVDCPSGKVVAGKCAPLGNGCNGNSAATCLTNNPITKNLNNIIGFLSAGVGIFVIGMIILGGIQYTLAGDNQTATGEAKKRITNGLIALMVFLFLFAFLQWLVPGGL